MIESEITAWLLRAESSVLMHMPAGNFSWDDAEAPLSPAVVARRGQGKAEYNTHGSIDLSRTEVTFECYAAQKLDCVLLAQAVGYEVGLLRGGEIFWTMFKEMPDGGFHRESARFRRDVKFEIVHREGGLQEWLPV